MVQLRREAVRPIVVMFATALAHEAYRGPAMTDVSTYDSPGTAGIGGFPFLVNILGVTLQTRETEESVGLGTGEPGAAPTEAGKCNYMSLYRTRLRPASDATGKVFVDATGCRVGNDPDRRDDSGEGLRNRTQGSSHRHRRRITPTEDRQ